MNDGPRRGYSLSALFVLMTACAVLVAGFTPLIRLAIAGEIESGLLFFAGLAGLVLGGLLGLIVGLLHFRRVTGAIVGGWAGCVIGAAAGLIALLPIQSLPAVGLAMLVGSGLIVFVALMNRRTNGVGRSPPASSNRER